MPNQGLANLYFTAADYKIFLIIPGGGSFPLQTCQVADADNDEEEETMYVIGNEYPAANKTNAVKYSGKLEIEAGELNAIAQVIGVTDGSRIRNAILAIAALSGVFARTYTGVNIHSEKLSIKAKDKHTPMTLSWTALAIS
jgi:hypothetical protein